MAYENINGRVYAGNELKVVYINEDVYNKNFKNQKNLRRIIRKMWFLLFVCVY